MEHVQILGAISRTKMKHTYELIAFADGVKPAGIRDIINVPLTQTICLNRKLHINEYPQITSFFESYPSSPPLGQQAIAVFIEHDSLNIKGMLNLTPLGWATLSKENGMPIHLPSINLSTRKKLFAQNYTHLRNLLNEYKCYMNDPQGFTYHVTDEVKAQ
ncbi:hypothetical protein HUZ36_14180 [Pseudoalteromonas sp. McH1-7]|uniref:hypothetical protein n=1 Tax=Pseudoalteromonas sp. McH1-7 TaxID=2745574 RepID=UPI00159024BA|nr:hypothetical protein [Pseudoalteromonas sp. McH1-7]NUZ11932.1 hypothetical protein [Pseudoalteromonas sp. McH1-7]